MIKYYTVDEVAAITGLTSRTIRTYIAEGKLKGLRLGKQWRFTEEDIAALYTGPGASTALRGKIFKGPAARQAEEFLSKKHGNNTVCLIADCEDMTDESFGKLAAGLRNLCEQSEGTVSHEGRRIVFSGTAAQAESVLRLIRGE